MSDRKFLDHKDEHADGPCSACNAITAKINELMDDLDASDLHPGDRVNVAVGMVAYLFAQAIDPAHAFEAMQQTLLDIVKRTGDALQQAGKMRAVLAASPKANNQSLDSIRQEIVRLAAEATGDRSFDATKAIKDASRGIGFMAKGPTKPC